MFNPWYLVIWVKIQVQALLSTRNPATGENVLYGEYLFNAQGEDVVAGIRTPFPIAHLKEDNA